MSDKQKSKMEVWEIRFYYKQALLDRRQHTPEGAGAGSTEADNNAEENYEDEFEADSAGDGAVDDDDDGADTADEATVE